MDWSLLMADSIGHGQFTYHRNMDADVAQVAALFADRTRSAVLAAVLDGRALAAGELAHAPGVSAATVSSHLAKLCAADLIAVEPQGRHRSYYRLADERAGRAFEALATLAPVRPVRSLRQSRIATELRWARTCYDHLAGTLAVATCTALQAQGALIPVGDTYRLGPAADELFPQLGVDLGLARRARRSFARRCLDWSERRHHLAGALGAALLAAMVGRGWAIPRPSSRALTVTGQGLAALNTLLGVEVPAARGNELT